MDKFFKSVHCTSRSHCKACRTDLQFRQSIVRTFDGDDDNFECPFGKTSENLDENKPKEKNKAAASPKKEKKPEEAKMPSKITQAKNAAVAASKLAKQVVSLKKVKVSDEEYNRRMEICKGCDKFKKNRCTVCGCVSKWKNKLQTETCPIGKW
jgi:hypothetical protein